MRLGSRLLVGTSMYDSPAILADSVRASGAEVVTVSLRREAGGSRAGQSFWDLIKGLGVRVLPNTAGCRTVKEAVTTAQMAREIFDTPWIKLEVIGEDDTLQPDVFGLVEAARILSHDGFQVFPYTTEDLDRRGKADGRGLRGADAMGRADRIGARPQQRLRSQGACARIFRMSRSSSTLESARRRSGAALELGYDAVLLNTAIAKAGDAVAMAHAFKLAVEAGREAFLAKPMEPRDMAAPSTPVFGKAFS